MRFYISGKIKGDPDFREKFDRAEKLLRGMHHDVFNPAAEQPEGFTRKDFLDRDLRKLMKCDAILLLSDWADSEGAKLEEHYAEVVGMPIFEQENLFAGWRLALEEMQKEYAEKEGN